MSNLEFVTTADGSKTIFNAAVGENYHSKHGALQESRHVFLKSGLQFYLQSAANANAVSILEVGFGTGLNFLLSADFCIENNIQLSYTGIEAYPISGEMLLGTGYVQFVSKETFESLAESYERCLEQNQQVHPLVNLWIAHTNLENFRSEEQYDLIYFDAFAAIHQPEMWSDDALAISCRNLKPGGVFVTYAITGNLKRSMKALGFEIEKAPGAPGKREMLRAIKK